MKIKDTTSILKRVRSILSEGKFASSPLQALIVPSSDAHQSEYLAASDHRRAYVSGFTGSAGTAVITQKHAALWTDGRYFVQAENEMDTNWVLMKMGVKETPSIEDWLNSVLPPESFIGVNPFLYSNSSFEKMQKNLEKNGHILLPTTSDVVDAVWEGKPAKPHNPLILLEKDITGASVSSKINDLRLQMKGNKTNWLIITALDEIAWTLNMRGSDIKYNPVFFSYLILGVDSVQLFIDKSVVSNAVKMHLVSECEITFHDYDTVLEFMQEKCAKQTCWICGGSSRAIVSIIPKANRLMAPNSPVSVMKAVKNSCEINGMKASNTRDAVALCQYFHWMETEVFNGGVTECSAASKSLQFRKKQEKFVSLSFRTISSSGATGSIIHYTPSEEADRPVTSNELYLCDSGAQYLDGTTDTTRTVHFGTPTDFEKECFTRVLKGHIAVARAIFPAGTKAYLLDTLARMHLWEAGLDYMHGTGHGVGMFLNVHEGPVGIYIGSSSRVVQAANDIELKPGMIITDEPGYYETGKFGIRIENALLCVEASTPHHFADKQFLTFEPIAYIPIQKKMIKTSLLSEDEITWMNNYHSKCLEIVGGELKRQGLEETYSWLKEQTKQI